MLTALQSTALCGALLAAATSLAQQPSAPLRPMPTDGQCTPLPALRLPLSFSPGEVLDFDLDALGAQAGKMSMHTLPVREGMLPIEIRAETSTFFAKIRRAKGTGTSFLHPKTLRPHRYVEASVENDIEKHADVSFSAKTRQVVAQYRIGERTGRGQFRYANEGLDVAGAIYLMRQVPWKHGMEICFDLYGIRRLWRVVGKVEAREHVSLPLGEYDAWRISGEAIRHDDHRSRREVHVWISDDERRLPLVAMGTMDFGTVRATLTGIRRPGEKKVRAQGKESLKW